MQALAAKPEGARASNTTSELLLKSYGREFDRLAKKMDKATDKVFERGTKKRWEKCKSISDDLYDICGLMARVPAKTTTTKKIKARAAAYAFFVPDGDETKHEIDCMEAIVESALADLLD